jgi:hypothetical protein
MRASDQTLEGLADAGWQRAEQMSFIGGELDLWIRSP